MENIQENLNGLIKYKYVKIWIVFNDINRNANKTWTVFIISICIYNKIYTFKF